MEKITLLKGSKILTHPTLELMKAEILNRKPFRTIREFADRETERLAHSLGYRVVKDTDDVEKVGLTPMAHFIPD
jgi:hypothetical protein